MLPLVVTKQHYIGDEDERVHFSEQFYLCKTCHECVLGTVFDAQSV